MKIDRAALRTLRLPLLALVAALAAAGAIVAYSGGRLHMEREHLDRLKHDQAMALQKVVRSGDENNLITRYLGDYQRLERQGFVGRESRINWLDALRTTNQDLKLYGVEYDFEAQQDSAKSASTGTLLPAGHSSAELAPLHLRQTAMKLRFDLLHEGDLMRFFDHLAAQNVGLFILDSCTLQRLGSVAQDASLVLSGRNQPHLRAECRLSWFTVNPSGDTP